MMGTAAAVVGGLAAGAYTHYDPGRTRKQIAFAWACWTTVFLTYAGSVVLLTDADTIVNRGTLVASMAVCSAVLVGGTYSQVRRNWVVGTVFTTMAVSVVCMQIVLYVSAALYRKFVSEGPTDSFTDPILVGLLYFAGCAVADGAYWYYRYKAKGLMKEAKEQGSDILGAGIAAGIAAVDEATNPANLDRGGHYTSGGQYVPVQGSRYSYDYVETTDDDDDTDENIWDYSEWERRQNRGRDRVTKHNAWQRRFRPTKKALQDIDTKLHLRHAGQKNFLREARNVTRDTFHDANSHDEDMFHDTYEGRGTH